MDYRIIGLILFTIIIAKVRNVNTFAGYKWISMKSGDPIPENSVLIKYSNDWYVGRSSHSDFILPAKVHKNGSAFISAANGDIRPRDKFEILTSSDSRCKWREDFELDKNKDNIVRVGTAANGEPIFIGYDIFSENIGSIYLNSGKIYVWSYDYPKLVFGMQYLCCEMKTKWTDYSPKSKLPNNAVSGGKSKDGRHEIYVARWKRGYFIETVIGQCIQENDSDAKAFLYDDNSTNEVREFDVLIGEPNEYTWVAAGNGTIPDYAVAVSEIFFTPRISYVARIDKTIRKLTHLETCNKSNYEILVMKYL